MEAPHLTKAQLLSSQCHRRSLFLPHLHAWAPWLVVVQVGPKGQAHAQPMDHQGERFQEDLSNQLGAGVSSRPWAIHMVVDMRSCLVVSDEGADSQAAHQEDLATLRDALQVVALANPMVVGLYGLGLQVHANH